MGTIFATNYTNLTMRFSELTFYILRRNLVGKDLGNVIFQN